MIRVAYTDMPAPAVCRGCQPRCPYTYGALQSMRRIGCGCGCGCLSVWLCRVAFQQEVDASAAAVTVAVCLSGCVVSGLSMFCP
jgi:hypothetical protein